MIKKRNKNKYSRTVGAPCIVETENKKTTWVLNEIDPGHLVVLIAMRITIRVQRWMNFKTIKKDCTSSRTIQPPSLENF